MKLLFWLALFLLVYGALRNKNRKIHKSHTASQGAASQAHQGAVHSGAPESMLQCRQCGVYFPASEAIRDTFGEAFCSEEHRRMSGPESGAC